MLPSNLAVRTEGSEIKKIDDMVGSLWWKFDLQSLPQADDKYLTLP